MGKSVRIFLMATLGALSLAGCATEVMSEKECLAGDWYSAGFADGSQGLREIMYDVRADQCTKFGVASYPDEYFRGREAGLDQLCTESGGYSFGRRGSIYESVCGAEEDQDFLSGYLMGKRIYGLESFREGSQEKYDRAVRRAESLRERRREARYVLDDPAATAEELEDARKDFDYAVSALRRAERDSEDALYQLGRADEALDQGIATQSQWRESSDFARIQQTLLEAHALARGEDSIGYCADESSFNPVTCHIYPGQTVTDVSGAICAVGPGEARMVARRGGVRPVHDYVFYPGEAGSGRAARGGNGRFSVQFDGAGEDLTFEIVSCG